MRAGIKTLLQRPALRTIAFATMVFLFYATRVRPPDLISDVYLEGRHGYLAVGESGLVVLDFYSDDLANTLRDDPESVVEYVTGAKVNAVEVVDDRIFLANDGQGLLILSKSQLFESILPPAEQQDNIPAAEEKEAIKDDEYKTPGKALDLAVRGNYVYIVDTSEDIAIVNVKNEIDPERDVSFHDIPNDKARKIQIVNGVVYIATDKGQLVQYSIGPDKNLVDEKVFPIETDIHNFRVVGNQAYLALGNQGLAILDLTAEVNGTNPTKYQEIKAFDINVQGQYLHIAGQGEGLLVYSAKDLNNLVLIGQDKTPSKANLIFGIKDNVYVANGKDGLKNFVSRVQFEFEEKHDSIEQGNYQDVVIHENTAYIAAGETGLQIIDIEDPTNPVNKFYFDETVGDDWATSVEVSGEFLYITYRKKGLRSFYLSDLAPSDTEYGTDGEANDVAIVDDWAYMAAGKAGLQVCSLEDIFWGSCYYEDTSGTALGVFVLDDYAYIADDDQGLQIIQVSDPEKPTQIARVNTQGRAKAIYVVKQKDSANQERTYAFIANGDQGLFIADVTDPRNPSQVAIMDIGSHANDIKVVGNRVYLSDKSDGLMIIDVSTISSPVLKGNRATPGQALGLYLSDDLGYIADDDHGLRIISVDNEDEPKEIGFHDIPKNVKKLVVDGDYGYLVDGTSGMWVLNLKTPSLPISIAFYRTDGEANDIAVQDNYAYIADGSAGVEIVKVLDPYKPTHEGRFKGLGNALTVAADDGGEKIYVGTRDNKVHILDIRDKENIDEIKSFDTAEKPLDLQEYRDYVYVSEGEKGLEIFYVEDPEDIESYRANEDLGLTDTRAVEILRQQEHILVADGKNGMKVFQVSRPFAPQQIYHFPVEVELGVANSIAVSDNYAFLSAGDQGVIVFYIWDLSRIQEVGNHSLEQSGAIAALSATDSGDDKDDDKNKDKEKEIRNNRYFNYISAGEGGLRTYQVDGQAVVKYLGEYESIGEATFRQVVGQLFNALTNLNKNLVQEKVWTRLKYLAFGLFTLFFVSGLWLVIFAQFVLPVQTVTGGKEAIRRLFLSLWGRDGPAVFVKEGKIIGKPKEEEKDGPGVVRVDLNSAVVLERRFPKRKQGQREYREHIKEEEKAGRVFPRTRVAGSGVKFTYPYEIVRGAADLRPQFRIRPGVKAYTRDGIEFNNPVWVLFTLGQSPEVLDVAYDGARNAENLKVIKLDDPKSGSDDEKVQPGEKEIKFSDELDLEDRQEIHRYVQSQLVEQFADRVKKMALNLESAQGMEVIDGFIKKISRLAENLGISTRSEIEKFLSDCQTFIDTKTINEQSTVDWFVYQVIRAASALGSRGSLALFDAIYRSEVSHYQTGLQTIQVALEIKDSNLPPRVLRQKKILLSQNFQDDGEKRFVFYAIGFRHFAREQITDILDSLKDGPVDKVLRERWKSYLSSLDQITRNLISGKYPVFRVYVIVAWMHSCFLTAKKLSPLDGLRRNSASLQIFNLWAIRRRVRKIQKNLDKLAALTPPELERYPDFVQLETFNRYRKDGLSELRRKIIVVATDGRQAETERSNLEAIRKYVSQLNQSVPLLNLVQHKAYRKYAQDLGKLIGKLDDEFASVLDFSKQADRIWVELEAKNKKAIGRYFNRARRWANQIQTDTYKLENEIKSAKGNEEITKYRLWIKEVTRQLKSSGVYELSLDAASSQNSQIGPFLFDRERVLAAVYSEALNKDQYAGEDEHLHWTELPAHVAVQIYRDMVSKEQYDNLYQPNNPDQFNIPKLKGNMARAVRNQGVLAFRYVERFDGQPLDEKINVQKQDFSYYGKRELTNPKVLRARGIKVIASGFPDLFPVHSQVSGQLLDYWRSSWERNASERRSQSELQAVRVINQARAQAQRDMAHTLAQIMQSSRSDEALAMRVFQALESIAINTDNRQFLPRDTMFLLRSFKRWFLPEGDSDTEDDLGDGNELPGSDIPYIEG